MKKSLTALTISITLSACSSTQVEPTEPTSYIIDRQIISIYNPLPDGKYANFSDWGREYARMHSQLSRCANSNVLTGKFMERIKLSSMVLGKDKYNQVMFAIRDQSSQMMSHLNQLPNDLLNEYYAPLPASICTEVKRTADLMIFDALDYGMKWREAVNEPVKLSDWKVYPEFAQALGNVEYDSNGYVVRDPQGNVIFLPEQ